jgi:hypothetical protein
MAAPTSAAGPDMEFLHVAQAFPGPHETDGMSTRLPGNAPSHLGPGPIVLLDAAA